MLIFGTFDSNFKFVLYRADTVFNVTIIWTMSSSQRLAKGKLFAAAYFFYGSCMEIPLSAAEEKLMHADLGPLFSFDLIHNENSWLLHSGYWRPWQWTVCMTLSKKLWLTDKPLWVQYYYPKSKPVQKKKAVRGIMRISCGDGCCGF